MKKKQKENKNPKCGIVGGQAVLEGVMMKSGDRCSLAVRTPDGGITLDNSEFVSLRKKYKICRLPIVRGCVSMVEQIALSMNMLTKSAEKFDGTHTCEKSPGKRYTCQVAQNSVKQGCHCEFIICIACFFAESFFEITIHHRHRHILTKGCEDIGSI